MRRSTSAGRPWNDGDAAVGDARVVQVFVAERDLRPALGAKREGRRDAVALEVDAVPEAVRVLEHAVQTRTATLSFSGWSRSAVTRLLP